MNNTFVQIMVLMSLLFIGRTALCEDLVFTTNFDKESNVSFWTGKKGYKINFMGLTDERTYTGDKVFKLDMTITQDKPGYFFFKIPCSIYPKKNMKLHVKCLLAKENTAKVTFFFNSVYPNLRKSASPRIEKPIKTTHNKWKDLTFDLDKYYKKTADYMIKKYAKGVNRKLLQPKMKYIAIGVYGSKKNGRVILYISDIKIYGDVYYAGEYSKILKKNKPLIEASRK